MKNKNKQKKNWRQRCAWTIKKSVSEVCPGREGWRGMNVESEMEKEYGNRSRRQHTMWSVCRRPEEMGHRIAPPLASLMNVPHFLLGLFNELKAHPRLIPTLWPRRSLFGDALHPNHKVSEVLLPLLLHVRYSHDGALSKHFLWGGERGKSRDSLRKAKWWVTTVV